MTSGPQNYHPENDLRDDDSSRLDDKGPQTIDELAYTEDPGVIAQLDEQSSRQAIRYLAGILILSFVIGLGTLLISRLLGGPLCDSGEEVWLCTDASQIWWPIVAWTVPFFGMIGCAVIMVRKLNARIRWRAWMGAFWVLVPNAMFWGLAAVQVLAL